jgi:hypothetical protein
MQRGRRGEALFRGTALGEIIEINMKNKGILPIGPTGVAPANVAVQRPTVNIKEAENLGEQAVAASHVHPEIRMSKHGAFGKPVSHPVEQMWG